MVSRDSETKGLLAPGMLFAGKYRVISRLGTGNFATVFKAKQEGTEREVAIKVLKPEVVDSNPEVAQRFVDEVNIVSRLSHPNTVTLHDFGRTSEGLYFMVLELLEGTSLEDAVKEGALPPLRVIRITQQLLKSLDEAHNLGIVHRDLKPSNIMLVNRGGEQDIVKVLDFGVAKLMADSDDELESLTPGLRRSTQFVGTPIYMSPEQVLGQKVRPSSDIYSLGLILYEMLTGDPPVDPTLNVSAVAQIHIDDKPIPFAKIANLPRPFIKLIRKATSRDPEERYQSVREFARSLPRQSDMEFTGEFKKLIGSDDDEDSVPLVFKGQTYVSVPDEDLPDPVARSREIPVAEVRPLREARKFDAKEDLRLDVGKVRRSDQRRRVSPTPEDPGTAGSALSAQDAGWLAGGFVFFFVGWHLTGALIPGSPLVQGLLGLLSAGLALTWAGFSEVRSIQGNLVHKWLIPFCKSQGAILVILLLLMIVGFPSYTLQALETSRQWPADLMPFLQPITGIFDLWVGPLRRILALSASLVPW